jgi:GMP synthase (glutamine-hydrolysing)
MQTQMLVDEAVETLQSQISDTAIIACSGGIDSTVAAILAHRAVGSLLHCVYVDTGLMRKHESDEVAEMFADMGIELKVVDASERFFNHLKGITEVLLKKLHVENIEFKPVQGTPYHPGVAAALLIDSGSLNT